MSSDQTPSVHTFQNLAKQTERIKIAIATVETMGLAEKIIDDISLVFLYSLLARLVRFLRHRLPCPRPRGTTATAPTPTAACNCKTTTVTAV